MAIFYSIPVVLSSFVITAHFYRNNFQLVGFFCLLLPLLLFLKRSWVPKIVTAFLVLYSIEWLRTMLYLTDQYKLQGRPFSKLILILSSVIVFTLLSSVVFKSQVMKKRYGQEEDRYLRLNL
jgi:hypothetical protein